MYRRVKDKNNKKKNKVLKKIIRRLLISLLAFLLLFTALNLNNKNNEMDILIKRHTQQTMDYDNKIRELETEIKMLEETAVFQHELHVERIEEVKADFRVPTVQPQEPQEMIVNINPKVSESPQVVTIEDVKEEVHNKNNIEIGTFDKVGTAIITTLVIGKEILKVFVKPLKVLP